MDDGLVEGREEFVPGDVGLVGVGVRDFFDDGGGKKVGVERVGNKRFVGVPNGDGARGRPHPVDAMVGEGGVLANGGTTGDTKTMNRISVVLVGFIDGEGTFVGVDNFVHLW